MNAKTPPTVFDVRVRKSFQQNLRSTVFFQTLTLRIGIGVFALVGVLLIWVTWLEWDDTGVVPLPNLIAILVFFGLAVVSALLVRHATVRARGPLEAGVHFTVTESTLEFPKIGRLRPAESWPLAQTTVHVKPGRWGTLTLEAPGKKKRGYGQALLQDSVEDIYTAIMKQKDLCTKKW